MPEPINPPPITVTFLIALCTADELEKFLAITPNCAIFIILYYTYLQVQVYYITDLAQQTLSKVIKLTPKFNSGCPKKDNNIGPNL